jgi:hypothetical protein
MRARGFLRLGVGHGRRGVISASYQREPLCRIASMQSARSPATRGFSLARANTRGKLPLDPPCKPLHVLGGATAGARAAAVTGLALFWEV